ncbi:MAG TPA: hypothetical protein VGJ05_20035 [Fimbriiglobus sp.]|jgi:hypothetical protein
MASRPVTLYSNPKQLAYYIVGGAVGLALCILLVRGLSVTPPPVSKNTEADKKAEDPWPQISSDLSRDTDVETCRRALDRLTTVLASNPEFVTPPGLTATEEKTLRGFFPGFVDEDARELRSPAYTRLDPYHLAECYYLRDAARALDVADLAPVEQARRAFEFVCRQVYVNPWLLPVGDGRVQPMPPVPPAYVLRRGWGTGLERAMVFLALLRQLGLDGCLIGPAGAESKSSLYATPEKAGSLESLKGPFWAVGVRTGPDIFLFEPWRGDTFPGPDGKGISTLAQLKSNPQLVEVWAQDRRIPFDVAPSDLRTGEVYLATPLSSLAPRMKMLEEKLTRSSAVKLYVDAAGTCDRFVKEKATSDRPKWWSPPPSVGGFDVFHVLASFLPTDDGGRDKAQPQNRKTLYQISLLPTTLFAAAPELQSREAANVLRGYMQNVYTALYLTPPSPLERIQRGSYFDVATYLTEKERGFSQAVQRFRGAPSFPPAVRQFVDDLNAAYGELQQARTRAVRDPVEESACRAEIDKLWNRREFTGLIVERGLAEPAEAEATYLLALCKHEAAVRASIRAVRAMTAARDAGADPKADPEKLKEIRAQAATARVAATGAWKEARTWWLQYDTVKLAQQVAFPGRIEHAARLTAEAADRVAGS